MLVEVLAHVGGVAGVSAVVPKAAHAVHQRLVEQISLVERRRAHGSPDIFGSTGEQRQMVESDGTIAQRRHRGGQRSRLLTNPNSARGVASAHVAFVPDPLHRIRRTLAVVVVGLHILGSEERELQLHQIGHASQRDQLPSDHQATVSGVFPHAGPEPLSDA